MNGTGNGAFSPKATTTRAMVVTILYRISGSPDTVYTSSAMCPGQVVFGRHQLGRQQQHRQAPAMETSPPTIP